MAPTRPIRWMSNAELISAYHQMLSYPNKFQLLEMLFSYTIYKAMTYKSPIKNVDK